MATSFSTEQTLPFSFQVVDGRGRPVPIDGAPTVTVSDETIATASIAAAADANQTWAGELVSVSASPDGTTQRMTIQCDADLGAGILEIVGVLDFQVTLDPRTEARTANVTAGTPADKPI